MTLGSLFGDLIGSLLRRPATEPYPRGKISAPVRLRGPVQWDRLKCTGCGVCVMDCPANALVLFVRDKAIKQFVLEYHIDRCTFCGQCTESCKQDALWMSNSDWQLARSDVESLTVRYGAPED